ncbi:MAG: hypothetical protein LBE89_04505 [Helicobacteraceae bacterium]|nr:hypothetical protein [Helicobacteraceae bacterium]
MLGFLKKIFGSDEQIDFFAKIYAALIVSGDMPRGEIDVRALKFCAALFMEKDDCGFFLERTVYYVELNDKNELHINQLIRRIDVLSRQNPEWIKKLTDEAIEICYCENPDSLQIRVIEYLQGLVAGQLSSV